MRRPFAFACTRHLPGFRFPSKTMAKASISRKTKGWAYSGSRNASPVWAVLVRYIQCPAEGPCLASNCPTNTARAMETPTNEKKIRILLADDHTVVRRGLRLLLEGQPEFSVVAEAADGKQAVDAAEAAQP